ISNTLPKDNQNIETIAEGLTIPWEVTFLPNGEWLATERPGRLWRSGGDNSPITIEGVHYSGEGGLLGMALHPQFQTNGWIYLYYTSQNDGLIENQVSRYVFDGQQNRLTNAKTILGGIPGSANHHGGRIAFGPDGYLYITTGDAQQSETAQDITSLAGKILRVDENGNIPSDNPFGNQVYSFGHRNPQGLTWDAEGQLWSTEHGRSGLASGFDELNQIESGNNYGWPAIQGDETGEGFRNPIIHSGATDTWAPAGMAFHQGKIYFAGLRGEALYEYDLVTHELKIHFKHRFGRLRAVVAQADALYLSTSNLDGRGIPRVGDDRIIRINWSYFKDT
ncbi:MAG: PQQ-dependent sugar dehydrogenase, partial [archaeon]|nr:PQQ-dependent sugar dehydrogenase [archaeon]